MSNSVKGAAKESPGATRLLTCLVIILIAVNIGLLSRDLQVGTYIDDGAYVTLARSLATGHGFSDANDPLTPPHNKFAPGYPVILVPIALFAGNALWPLQAFNVLLTVFMLWLCRRYLSSLMTPAQTLAVLAMTGCGTLIASHATMVMSESSFLILVLLALLAYRKLSAEEGARLGFEMGLAAAVTAAYFVRTVGLSLVASTLALSAFARAWRRVLVIAVVFGLIAGLWAMRSNSVSHTVVSSVYQKSLGETRAADVAANAWDYVSRLIPSAMIPLVEHPKVQQAASSVHADWIRRGLMLVVTLMVFIGWARAAYDERRRLEAAFVALYFVLLLPWPDYYKGVRYVYPMVPFFYSYVVDVYCLFAWRRKAGSAKLGVALVALTVLLFSLHNLALFRSPTRNRIRDISIGATWIRDNAPRDAVVMARNPMSIWLYAGRPVVAMPDRLSELDAVARKRRVTYILIGPQFSKPDDEPNVPAKVEDPGGGYGRVFSDPAHHTYVFRRLGP